MKKIQNTWHGFVRHLQIWRLAWQYENTKPKKKDLKKQELEFLPAVLEIQETPASPVGRTTAGVILLLFILAIIWASFGEIDIVAIAQGKIIPSDHSKVIQPLDTGVIRAIHVDEGQQVKQGELLIELDDTVIGAEHDRVTNELQAVEMQASRLRALLDSKVQLIAPQGLSERQLKMQKKLLQEQRDEYRARIGSARSTIEQRNAAVEITNENIKHLTNSVELLKERAEAVKRMVDKNFMSRIKYLEIQEIYLEKSQELAANIKQQPLDQAALSEAKTNYQAIKAEFNKSIRTQLADVETRARSLSQESIKTANRTRYQQITAPIDGIVQQLAVHTVGGVVTPAQQLMIIVPKEDQLEIEAWVENKDIGFVDPGQKVEIKVEAFPFTRYGVIDGQIQHLSQDAVALENVGYVYTARVQMEKSVINVGNKLVNLSPGMTVTVEVKTGKRRLIEFFLSPLLRGIQETAHER